ncbi:hypothetical protein [Streptomyces mirabilis]|uniref:hypothetical protein n=1 Tax=Streptomyces mirabilis TaxID=68239 RepID=UPI0036DB90CD
MSTPAIAIMVSIGSLVISAVTATMSIATYRRGRPRVRIKSYVVWDRTRPTWRLDLYNRGVAPVRITKIGVYFKGMPFLQPAEIVEMEPANSETLGPFDGCSWKVVVRSDIRAEGRRMKFIASLADGSRVTSRWDKHAAILDTPYAEPDQRQLAFDDIQEEEE